MSYLELVKELVSIWESGPEMNNESWDEFQALRLDWQQRTGKLLTINRLHNMSQWLRRIER